MKIQAYLVAVLIAVSHSVHAVETLSQDKDYYSLQIASGQHSDAMEKLFQRHAYLPFVRIEKRGSLYVLRAGFWDDQAAARLAISNSNIDASFLRMAAFRPDAIILKNWQDGDSASGPTLRKPAKPQSDPVAPSQLPVPAPPATASPPVEGGGDSVLLPFNQEDFVLAYDVFIGSGDLEQAYRVAEKAARQAPQDGEWQKRLATVAAWTQRQDVAAQYYFLARRQTRDRAEARRLFLAGIDALMSGSRFKQAMEAADKHLGDLGDDPATLRHLARTALAAGEPARAATYIDKLVFRPKTAQGKP